MLPSPGCLCLHECEAYTKEWAQTIYFMLRQEVRKAWRVTGLMVQSAFEVGLHRERYYRHSNTTAERSSFLKRLMACVVDLDKRCSFMVNLPYHLHDREIDDSVLDLVRCFISPHEPKIKAPATWKQYS